MADQTDTPAADWAVTKAHEIANYMLAGELVSMDEINHVAAILRAAEQRGYERGYKAGAGDDRP